MSLPPLPLAQVEELLAVHMDRGLRLVPADNQDLVLHSNEDPLGLVTEVLRLAFLGAHVEQQQLVDAEALRLADAGRALLRSHR